MAEKASAVAGAKNAGVVKKGDEHNFTGFDCSSGILMPQHGVPHLPLAFATLTG
jgi:hypothetical protein